MIMVVVRVDNVRELPSPSLERLHVGIHLLPRDPSCLLSGSTATAPLRAACLQVMHTGPIRSFSGLYCCTRLRSIDGSSETGRRVMNEVTIIIAQARKLFDLQVSGRHRRACAAAGTPQAWQEFMVKACSTLVRACSTRINLTAQETTLNPTASHTLYKHKKNRTRSCGVLYTSVLYTRHNSPGRTDAACIMRRTEMQLPTASS